MSPAIAVFAKTLGLSPVKTRLAASIGKENAEQFYQLCLNIIEETIDIATNNTKPPLTAYWAIAEQEAITHPAWKNLNQIWTGEGDLGERLHNIYSTLRKTHDTVILIGTDCPQLNPQHIKEAISYLANNSGFVIGKALDGGFYLFAGNTEIAPNIWLDTPYSTSSTCKTLTEKLALQNNIHYLNDLTDIDTIEDLQTLTHLNTNIKQPSKQKLIHWINNLLDR